MCYCVKCLAIKEYTAKRVFNTDFGIIKGDMVMKGNYKDQLLSPETGDGRRETGDGRREE